MRTGTLPACCSTRAPTRTRRRTGFTALHLATQIRRPELLKFATPASTDKLDSLDVIKALIARGADVNARMTKGFIGLRQPLDMPLAGATPFFLAARVVDVPVMQLLVDKGADPLLRTNENATPLMTAAGVGYRQGESPGTEEEALAAVKLAFELGDDINAANGIGFTALHGAAIRGANSIIQFLVDNGARINAQGQARAHGFHRGGRGRRRLQPAAAVGHGRLPARVDDAQLATALRLGAAMFRLAAAVLVVLLAASGTAAEQAAAQAPSALPSVYVEELTWVEVRDALKAGTTTVIIPSGGTEQSGPHLVLGKENFAIHFAAGEVARRLGNALVAPTLQYVPEGNVDPPSGHMRFPG